MAAWVSVTCPVRSCEYSARFRVSRPSPQSDDGGRADARLTLRDEHPHHGEEAPEDEIAEIVGVPEATESR